MLCDSLPAVIAAAYGALGLTLLSLLITIGHTIEEATAEAPIWQYLSRIYLGRNVAAVVGLTGLVLFAAGQCALGVLFYAYELQLCGAVLACIRLGDAVVSHWYPWLWGYRPNPGMVSSSLYLLEFTGIAYYLLTM